MNRLKFLREERAKVSTEQSEIVATCEKEKRSRTTDEATKWKELSTKIDAFDEEIKDLEKFEEQEKRNAKPVGKPGGESEGDEGNDGDDESEKRSVKKKDMSIRAQVSEWQKRNADAIKKLKNQQKAELEPMELRAANSPMTPTNTFTDTVSLGAGALIRDGAQVVDLLRIQPTLWDFLPKGRTNKETYTWVNKKVPATSGAADFLAPGAAKPKVSFTLTTEKSNAKKVAVSMKVATELLDDVDGMTSLIEQELRYQLKYEINRVIMSANAATSDDPAGIRSFAVAYTLTGVQTTNPNNYDAVQAGIAQMRASYVDGPILVLMNPIDVVNMKITKAISQGQYMGLNIAPIPGGFIVEDYNVTAGDVMFIALDYLKILIYKDFRLAYGWENDDFTKNLVTVIAETRFHEFHSDNHAAGFVYDQLADIKTAIAVV